MRFLFVLIGLFSGISTAYAHQVRHRDPHVHGQANMQVALDGDALSVEFESPGIGLLDFEHPPGDAAQRSKLDEVMAALRNPQWLQFPVAAHCALDGSRVAPEGYDHLVDDPDEPGHHHAGFHAWYEFNCSKPTRLDHLQVLLPQRYAGLHKVIVESITPGGQGRAEVIAGRPRVNLPR